MQVEEYRTRSPWIHRVRPFLPFAVLLLLLIQILAVPPLDGPDENAHLLRAAAIASGGVLPVIAGKTGASPTAGGLVDDSILRFDRLLGPLVEQESASFPRWALRETARIPASGQTIYQPFSNTAIYPPQAYAIGVVPVIAARALGLPVLFWLYLGRVGSAVAALLVMLWLSRTAPRRVPLAAALILLPSVFFQLSVFTADSTILLASVVFGALVGTIVDGNASGRRHKAGLLISMLFVATSKIAYLPFCLWPSLVAAGRRRRDAVIAYVLLALLVVVVWISWSLIIKDGIFSISPFPDVDPKRQVAYILHHPSAALATICRAMVSQAGAEAYMLIGGVLGTGRVTPPALTIAADVLAVAAVTAATMDLGRRAARQIATAAVIGLGCWFVIYLLLYVQFNTVGSGVVEGVQGRYFLPFAIVGLLGLPLRQRPEGRTRETVVGAASMVSVACALSVSVLSYLVYWT